MDLAVQLQGFAGADRGASRVLHAPTQPVAEDTAGLVSALSAEESRQIGAYRLVERVGVGAMGHVYRAQHVLLERMVAIKMLRPELAQDEAFVARFFAEARAVNLINHQHVIAVTDFARDAHGTPWFVMELLDGADLAVVMTREAIGLARVLEIVRQLCAALSAVHAAGIVHRDVKPENTFISTRDGKDFVKLIDFGVARLPDSASADPLKTPEGMVGTPPYMSPEQVAALEVDHRADLYAVGTVLFELVTGNAPFHRDDMRVLLDDIACTVPRLPSELVRVPEAVRADLDGLIARCLEKDPDKRPQTAQEIGEAIVELAQRLQAPVLFVHEAPMLVLSRQTEHTLPKPTWRISPWRHAASMAAAVALLWLLPMRLDETALTQDVLPEALIADLPTAAAYDAEPLATPFAEVVAPPSDWVAAQEAAEEAAEEAAQAAPDRLATPGRAEPTGARARRGVVRSKAVRPVLVVTPSASRELAEIALPEPIVLDRELVMNPFQR